MTLEADLISRSGGVCELCSGDEGLVVHPIGPGDGGTLAMAALVCLECRTQLEGNMSADHWRGLADSMWSEYPPVQVLAWRALNRLRGETWASDLFDMLYLEPEVRAWAEAGAGTKDRQDAVIHRDSNGSVLVAGDAVVLTKDLQVKGAGFTAKRGTVVRNISLVTDNAAHIEGRVEGQRIVILTGFVKKK